MRDRRERRVEELFQRAADLPDEARGPFLESHCGADRGLRREIESLLRHEREATGSFLERPGPAAAALLLEPPGAVIGPYRIVEPIGQGTFGDVYLAEQLQPLRRRVAVKILKPGMDSRQVMARFESERQALALMDHPNVARIFDAGTTETGRPYLVMEHVPGVPITEHCDRRRLSLEARLTVFMLVCDAVQHAHQKGIIHRDLKPTNILIKNGRDHGSRGLPMVIDFGVARALHHRLTDHTIVTEQGQVVGTPEYMSPEQAEMNFDDIDTRTDIYALGVLLYELLVGTLPFDPATLRRASFGEFQRIIRTHEPPRPSSRLGRLGADSMRCAWNRVSDPRTLRRKLCGDLDWITMKAMDKDRGRRYASTSELAADIRRHLRHEPVMAGPPGAAYRMRKYVRRHRVGVTAGAAVMLALVGGVIGTSWMALVATRAREGEARQREVAETVNDFFRNEVLASANPWREGTEELTLPGMLDEASRKIGRRFDNAPLIEASIRLTLGVTYRGLGEYEPAHVHLARAHQLLQTDVGDEHKATLDAKHQLGELAWRRGRYGDAERRFDEAVTVGRRVLGADDPQLLRAIRRLGMINRELGDFEKAEALLVEALERQRRALGPRHPHALSTMVSLAGLYERQRRLARAESLRLEVLEGRRRVLGQDHTGTWEAQNDLGGLYRLQGRYAEAEPLITHAVEMQRRTLGEEHQYTLWSQGNLGLLFLDQGRHAEARELFERLIAVRGRILGEQHPEVLDVADALGRLYLEQGRYEKAEAWLRQAVEGRRRILGEEHQDTLSSAGRLGALLMVRGRIEEAETVTVEVLELRRRLLGDRHPDTARSLCDLGELREAQGRYAEARRWHGAALELRRRSLGEHHPDTLASKNIMACLLATDEPVRMGEAETLARDAVAAAGRHIGSRHPDAIAYEDTLGVILARAGRRVEAVSLLRDLTGRASEALGDDHALTEVIRAHLDACLVGAGRPPTFVRRIRAREDTRTGP